MFRYSISTKKCKFLCTWRFFMCHCCGLHMHTFVLHTALSRSLVRCTVMLFLHNSKEPVSTSLTVPLSQEKNVRCRCVAVRPFHPASDSPSTHAVFLSFVIVPSNPLLPLPCRLCVPWVPADIVPNYECLQTNSRSLSEIWRRTTQAPATPVNRRGPDELPRDRHTITEDRRATQFSALL